MATKTFKIGLSNTDKQNMAQDVYERLLALTFPEYDSAESYDVGDFVVYNDQLYKCIGATTGAWDSTKWQLATLNDLVSDIENAVAFVNDKANVDGNYPTMTVGAADNLTPYSEDSGDDQNEPFIFQGTGCGNGTEQVDTGSLALSKEKRGNTVVVNNQAPEMTIANWGVSAPSEGSFAISNGEGTYTVINPGVAYNNGFRTANAINTPAGHKFLLIYSAKASSDFAIGGIVGGVTLSNQTLTTNYKTFFEIAESQGPTYLWFACRYPDAAANDTFTVKDVATIDLTQWFGSNDNIPSHLLSHPEDFFRYYQGSLAYNAGELVNSNGRYLKTIGRNQWDEVAKLGKTVDSSTGLEESASGVFCSDFIKVNPNTDYYFYNSGSGTYVSDFRVACYDKDQNYLGINGGWFNPNNTNHIIKMPSNCVYIRFKTSGSTYNNNITISIYYEGESGYDKYYPYEELSNIDTGTETLLAFDYKTPDGVWHKNTRLLSLGDLSFTYDSGNKQFYTDVIDGAVYGKVICNKYSYNPLGYTEVNEPHTRGIIGGRLYIVDESLSGDDSLLIGNVQIKVEQTTEQGTTFSENVQIDDFGSMEYAGANGVPQGNLLFYPVDYKAFLDTLYNQVGGDGSNVLPKVGSGESLSAGSPETLKQVLDYVDGLHAIEQANAGGTLRHMVSGVDFEDTDYLDLGSLTYSYYPNGSTESVDCYISSSADALLKNNAKAISSRFITSSTSTDPIIPNSFAIGSGSSKLYIWVTKNAYTDATAFKSAMKGVLLAYEKE